MALTPESAVHHLQIQAGTLGRRRGHQFEDKITELINELQLPHIVPSEIPAQHVFCGVPGVELLNYVCQREGFKTLVKVTALSTGALATSEDGKHALAVDGVDVTKCKSDVILTLEDGAGKVVTVGVSAKQCNVKTPANAQVYLSTASAFAKTLRDNGIPVSEGAEIGLKRFCGDAGYRPSDDADAMQNRETDPRHYFWEELSESARYELADIFQIHHRTILRLVLQRAYPGDAYPPKYVIHKTKKCTSESLTEVAIFSMDELAGLSEAYKGFETRAYRVRKGSHKDPPGVMHEAPRVGFLQMQRFGNQQNGTQLQFNLKAGYFYHLGEKPKDVSPEDLGE